MEKDWDWTMELDDDDRKAAYQTAGVADENDPKYREAQRKSFCILSRTVKNHMQAAVSSINPKVDADCGTSLWRLVVDAFEPHLNKTSFRLFQDFRKYALSGLKELKGDWRKYAQELEKREIEVEASGKDIDEFLKCSLVLDALKMYNAQWKKFAEDYIHDYKAGYTWQTLNDEARGRAAA
eukprot:433679-Rhodomonas_salina.1